MLARWRWSMALGAPVAAAVAACAVPGFDVLDYHACLALAPVVGMAAGLVAIEHLRLRSSGGFGPLAAFAWLALPLLVLLANGLRVPCCDRLTGLEFYALGLGVSAVLGAAMGAVAWRLSARCAGPVLVALAIGAAGPPLYFFAVHPQAFGLHPLIGWIAGPLYEDAVAPSWSVWAGRLAELGAWLPAAALALGAGRYRRLAAGLLFTGVLVFALRAGPEGWLVSEGRVRQTLSVTRQIDLAGLGGAPRPAVVLHLPRGEVFARRAGLLIRDVRFDYRELVRFFGRAPSEPLHVYVYPDAPRKRALMGAERVEMSKPWLRQVHLVWPAYGASVLRHELAHAFGADLAGGWLGVPLRHGLVPDPLLIEGLAVAAEWPIRDRLDPHQWALAMRRLGLAPPLTELLSPVTFFAWSGARSYTIAGSFLRWLGATYGAEVLRQAYRRADIEAATGRPLVDLEREWGVFLEREADLSSRPGAMQRARARFERKAIFLRPCALHVGRELARAWTLSAVGRYRQAATCLRRLDETLSDKLGGRRGEVAVALSDAAARGRSGDPEAGLEVLAAVVKEGGLRSEGRRAAAELLRGDLLWQAGRPQSARMRWRRALHRPISWATRRALEIRLASRMAASLLGAAARDLPWRVLVDRARRTLPGDVAVGYLWARAHLLDCRPPSGLAEALMQAGTLRVEDRPARAVLLEAQRLRAVRAALDDRCEQVRRLAAGQPWGLEQIRRCEEP